MGTAAAAVWDAVSLMVNVTATSNPFIWSTWVEDGTTLPLVEDTAYTVSLNMVDPEGDPAAVANMSLSWSMGTISLASPAGLTFWQGTGVGDSSVGFSGALAAVVSSLSGFSMIPSANVCGTASHLTIGVRKMGVASDWYIREVAVHVLCVNDPPVITVNHTLIWLTQTGAATFGNAISVSDVDLEDNDVASAGRLPARILVTINSTVGLIRLGSLLGITMLIGTGVADTTLQFEADILSANSALQNSDYFVPSSVQYASNGSIEIMVSDQGWHGSGGALSTSVTLTVTGEGFVSLSVPPLGPPGPVAYTGLTNETILLSPLQLLSVSMRPAALVNLSLTVDPLGSLSIAIPVAASSVVCYNGSSNASSLMCSGQLDHMQLAVNAISFRLRSADENCKRSCLLNSSLSYYVQNRQTGATWVSTAMRSSSIILTDATRRLSWSVTDSASSNGSLKVVCGSVDLSSVAVNSLELVDQNPPGGASAADNVYYHVRLTASQGAVSLASKAGLQYTSGDGYRDVAVEFDGTIHSVNAAVNGFSYDCLQVPSCSCVTATVTIQASQGSGLASHAFYFSIDAPASPTVLLPVPNALTLFTYQDTPAVITGIAVSADSCFTGLVSVVLESYPAGTRLSLAAPGAVVMTNGSGTNDPTMSFVGTVLAINVALASLTIVPPSSFIGIVSLQIQVNASGSIITSESVLVKVLPSSTNRLPSLVVTAPLNVSLQQGQSMALGSWLVLPTDLDVDIMFGATLLATVSVSVGSVRVDFENSWSSAMADGSVCPAGLLTPWESRSSLTLQGSSRTLSDIMGSLVYQAPRDWSGVDVITVTLFDTVCCGNSAGPPTTAVLNIAVTAAGVAPRIAVFNASLWMPWLDVPTASSSLLPLFTISYPTNGSALLTCTVTVEQPGSVSLTSTAGLQMLVSGGVNSSMMVFQGTASSISTALSAATYHAGTSALNRDGPLFMTVVVLDASSLPINVSSAAKLVFLTRNGRRSPLPSLALGDFALPIRTPLSSGMLISGLQMLDNGSSASSETDGGLFISMFSISVDSGVLRLSVKDGVTCYAEGHEQTSVAAAVDAVSNAASLLTCRGTDVQVNAVLQRLFYQSLRSASCGMVAVNITVQTVPILNSEFLAESTTNLNLQLNVLEVVC